MSHSAATASGRPLPGATRERFREHRGPTASPNTAGPRRARRKTLCDPPEHTAGEHRSPDPSSPPGAARAHRASAAGDGKGRDRTARLERVAAMGCPWAAVLPARAIAEPFSTPRPSPVGTRPQCDGRQLGRSRRESGRAPTGPRDGGPAGDAPRRPSWQPGARRAWIAANASVEEPPLPVRNPLRLRSAGGVVRSVAGAVDHAHGGLQHGSSTERFGCRSARRGRDFPTQSGTPRSGDGAVRSQLSRKAGAVSASLDKRARDPGSGRGAALQAGRANRLPPAAGDWAIVGRCPGQRFLESGSLAPITRERSALKLPTSSATCAGAGPSAVRFRASERCWAEEDRGLAPCWQVMNRPASVGLVAAVHQLIGNKHGPANAAKGRACPGLSPVKDGAKPVARLAGSDEDDGEMRGFVPGGSAPALDRRVAEFARSGRRGAPRPARAGVAPLSEHVAGGQRATNVVADRSPPPHLLPVGLAPVRHRADHASPSRTAIDADADEPREESDPDRVRTVEHRGLAPTGSGAQGSGQPARCGGSPPGALLCAIHEIAKPFVMQRRGVIARDDAATGEEILEPDRVSLWSET